MNSLSELQRDELVYVTCGKPWSDPQLSYSEQQRRTVLANLAADISHIRQYCALRDPAGTYLNLAFWLKKLACKESVKYWFQPVCFCVALSHGCSGISLLLKHGLLCDVFFGSGSFLWGGVIVHMPIPPS